VTHETSVSLNTFKHRAEAMATQVASLLLNIFINPDPGTECSGAQVKVKGSRYRPGVAQRVGRDIALLFHDRGTRRG